MTDRETEVRGRVTRVERDGLAFDVLDEGPRDGEPVVLLHGFPERSTSWRDVAPILHRAGLRTVAMDQRGYSAGARPPRRRDYRTSQLALDVVALIDRAVGPSGSAHVVGHDWGAIVGWTLAQRHPERVRTLTAASVPHPAAFVAAGRHSAQLLRSWYIGLFQLPVVPGLLARRPGGVLDRRLRAAGMTAAEVARVRTEIVEDGALPYALNWYRAMMLADPRAVRAKVRVPTTMVWSDSDTAVDRWGAEHCEKWVEASYRLVVLEGVSHWIPTQAPEPLAAAILDRVGGDR